MHTTRHINSIIKLNNGIEMPVVGLGVYKMQEGEEVENAILDALEAGYRMIDTAAVYGNEEGVGRAIKKSGLPREEVFVTTKLKRIESGYESALAAIDASLEKLGLSYVDLYLIHWPSASEDHAETINRREETWLAMEKIYRLGKARAIGVSNYLVRHLEEMKRYVHIMPAVNQVEFHPFLYQRELLDYCNQNGIRLQAYSPLVKGKKMNHEVLTGIAERYGKSVAQILIRWSIQKSCVAIPKSIHKDRIKENISVFDFEISDDNMNLIDSLNADEHFAWDPTPIL